MSTVHAAMAAALLLTARVMAPCVFMLNVSAEVSANEIMYVAI